LAGEESPETLTSSPANHVRVFRVRAKKIAECETDLNLPVFEPKAVTNFQLCDCSSSVNNPLFFSDASSIAGLRQGDVECYHEGHEETGLRLRAGKRGNSIAVQSLHRSHLGALQRGWRK
jgi:hypothetical protein